MPNTYFNAFMETIGGTYQPGSGRGPGSWDAFGRNVSRGHSRLGGLYGKLGTFQVGASIGEMGFGRIGMGSMAAGSVVMGFASGGIGGGLSMLATDLTISKAINRVQNIGVDGKDFKPMGGAATFGRTLSGYAGSIIGGALGEATGVPGMGFVGQIAGASMGAAPIAFMKRHPVALLAGAAAGGAMAAYKGGSALLKQGRQHRRMQQNMRTDGSMAAFQTQGAFTMRARAVEAISKSHMNARSAIGREASFMHQPRNYHSRYR
jgi:hypothetical protein